MKSSKLRTIFLVIIIFIFLGGIYLFTFAFELTKSGIVVRDESKPALKSLARKINAAVYDQATKHNPEGDVLPDSIDDSIKMKIKENLR